MIQIIIPGIFTALIGMYSIYQIILSQNPFFLLILLLCSYNVWNLFVSSSNPSEIYIADEKLILKSFSQVHEYKINEIRQFSMRAVSGNGRLYMTINEGGLFRGRYWVRTEEFNDDKELNDFFYDLDEKVNPESILTNARKQGRARLGKNR